MVAFNSSTVSAARIVADQNVVALDASVSIREAAKAMADRKIGSIAVREGDKIVGLVTERDLVMTVLARGGDVNQSMREAMRPGIPRVSAGASEEDCAALMREHATRHLLVESAGRVVGVVSMTDIIQVMLEEKQFVIEQLNTYIHGAELPSEPRLPS